MSSQFSWDALSLKALQARRLKEQYGCWLSRVQLPCLSHDELELSIIVNACTDVCVVFLKFLASYFAIDVHGLPLLHELSQDVRLRHFSRFEFRMERHIVKSRQVIQVDNTIASDIQLGISLAHKLSTEIVEVSADSSEEFIEADLAVVVLVKVLENTLKFGRAQCVAVLFETPLELWTVHLTVAVVVHASENDSESSNAMHSTTFKCRKHLDKHLVGRLALHSERWINIRVVASAHESEETSKLLIVKLSVTRLVVLSEERFKFLVLQSTAHSLKSFLELRELNSSVAFEVKMLEVATSSLSFVVCTVSSLSNLLKYDVFKLLSLVTRDLYNFG